MFNECSYNTLGNAAHAVVTVPAWQAAGFTDKASWKQAGGRAALDAGVPLSPGSTFIPPPGLPMLPGSGLIPGTPGAVDTSGGPSDGATSQPGASSGVGSLLSGIPSSYLLIGAAIILVMVLKK